MKYGHQNGTFFDLLQPRMEKPSGVFLFPITAHTRTKRFQMLLLAIRNQKPSGVFRECGSCVCSARQIALAIDMEKPSGATPVWNKPKLPQTTAGSDMNNVSNK